jgi:bacterioferritin (cytochrome b1)
MEKQAKERLRSRAAREQTARDALRESIEICEASWEELEAFLRRRAAQCHKQAQV